MCAASYYEYYKRCKWKRAICKGPSSCRWNDQCRQATVGTAARCLLQGLGEVAWRCTMKANDDKLNKGGKIIQSTGC